MGRVAGRKGRIYLSATNGGQAVPMVGQAKWSINFTTAKIDVTALGDATKQYVADLPDAAGTFEGFFDDTVDSTYAAAVDGLSRKLYLYPNVDVPGVYFYGTVLPDMSVNGGIGAATAVSASWSAATPVVKVG